MILILILDNVLFFNIFFLSDNIFNANTNTDINISWTTRLGLFYDVQSPSKTTIYKVVAGDIIPNADMKKYKINSRGTEEIDISVLNVRRNDGGIYQSVSPSGRHNVDGCCLLIITGWYYILFYFFIIKKYMWRNGFFNLSNAIEEYGVFKSEESLRAWKTTRPVHRKTSTLFN